MADLTCLKPDQHLARARLAELDFGHVKRLAELLEHRGADLHNERLLYVDGVVR